MRRFPTEQKQAQLDLETLAGNSESTGIPATTSPMRGSDLIHALTSKLSLQLRNTWQTRLQLIGQRLGESILGDPNRPVDATQRGLHHRLFRAHARQMPIFACSSSRRYYWSTAFKQKSILPACSGSTSMNLVSTPTNQRK